MGPCSEVPSVRRGLVPGGERGGALRRVNVGRAVLFAVCIEAVNVWQDGVHVRGLVIGGAGTFVFGVVMYEGFDRWNRRRKTDTSGPPPPLPPRPARADRDTGERE